jgi:hypothetical protein
VDNTQQGTSDPNAGTIYLVRAQSLSPSQAKTFATDLQGCLDRWHGVNLQAIPIDTAAKETQIANLLRSYGNNFGTPNQVGWHDQAAEVLNLFLSPTTGGVGSTSPMAGARSGTISTPGT